MGNFIPTTTPGVTVTVPTTTVAPTEPPRVYVPPPTTYTPTNPNPQYNECKPPDNSIGLNNTDCNILTNCIYAANSCYKLNFDNIGLLDSTTITCHTNRNKDASYTLQFQAVKTGIIYIIKKLAFVVNDIDNTDDENGNGILAATYLNIDMKNPLDKEKVLLIDSNGTLNFTLKITGGTGTYNFDFITITLTDVNNRTITLSNTSNVNTIYNVTSLTAMRNKMVKVNYDPSIAQKAQLLDTQNQSNINNIVKKM
uniref:Uncharacterized protein n=1 Tax=viral metagenome TaxID=1070528 RepID=A0A6C0HLL7_9ZZZZ